MWSVMKKYRFLRRNETLLKTDEYSWRGFVGWRSVLPYKAFRIKNKTVEIFFQRGVVVRRPLNTKAAAPRRGVAGKHASKGHAHRLPGVSAGGKRR